MNAASTTAFGRVEPPTALPVYLNPLNPGELIGRELAARHLTQSELSARTGLSPKHINQVIKSVVPLSPETALLIERTIGVSAVLLGNLEAQRQARETRQNAKSRLADFSAWFQKFPVKTLSEKRIIDPRQDLASQIDGLLKFFGIADPDAFERLYADSLVSFRRAQHLDVNAPATAVWLRIAEKSAEQEAEDTTVAAFNRKKFTKLLEDLPSLTKYPISEGIARLQSLCLECGVHVVLLPELQGTRACAATRWVADRPVVVLSGRGKTQDSLWFNFFHEAGHIVMHPKRRSAVQLDKAGDDVDGHESEANIFARDYLLRHTSQAVLTKITTRERAVELARKLDVDEGIVAGQAAYLHNKWAHFSQLRKQLKMPL